MSTAYPLAWPQGWPRAEARSYGRFGTMEDRGSYSARKSISIAEAVKRVRHEFGWLGVKNLADDIVLTTNLQLDLSGFPREGQGDPSDPGAAVYWQKPGQPTRVMAIDGYVRVADNIAAIAATLEAMRKIQRHGGAQILERAFTGFTAPPTPRSPWRILGVAPNATREAIEAAYRAKAKAAHPDAGGSTAAMAELNAARDAALRAS
jgi:hypothetical protein